MPEFVGAVDQGTTSTRFMVFDHDGREIGRHQLEHLQVLPRPGWVEHDPVQIWERTAEVIRVTLAGLGLDAADLAAVGIANQRETTVVWDRRTGRPYTNAIVWQDTRSAAIVAALERDGRGEVVRRRAGMPPATYFAGGKLKWVLDNVDGVRQAAERGEAIFGTIDSWLLWNLTGGVDGGVHVTDVTNASRTMLMDLATLAWDEELLTFFDVPRSMLPRICSSAEPEGHGTAHPRGPFGGPVTISGVLGDQQAALVGQACFGVGQAKSTYGTGSFLLLNTGAQVVRSQHGLVSTVAYRFGRDQPAYALEGSVAVTGAAVQWLRDQLGLISTSAEIEVLAAQVPDSGGVYFVPAFSGLYAPQWRADARGVIVGLTRFNTKGHLARSALEAICYQTRDVVEAMQRDSGVRIDVLRVDGGVTENGLCMQMQADILGVPVSRPAVGETTALGAAYAAGLAVGFWSSQDELYENWREGRRWTPAWDPSERSTGYRHWGRAVQRTLNWAESE